MKYRLNENKELIKVDEAEYYGGTAHKNDVSFQTIKDVVDFSKKNKGDLFILMSDNYDRGFGKYWVRDGKIAMMKTTGNPSYDFDKYKVKNLKKKNDNIVMLKKVKNR